MCLNINLNIYCFLGKNFIVLVDEYLIKVLSNFGDLVQKLTINAADISKEALSLLNEKSSESLKELGFELLNGENIVDWKNSFNNVKELSLIGASNFTSNKTFNEFFPNVEKLNVQNLFDWSFVESSFKNVKTLEFAFEPNNINDANEKQISTFFTNNQQIETLTLRKPSKKLFNIVANLTNLKSLELLLTENVDSTGDDVHFKTVKKLKIQSTSNFIPNGIIFDKLEDITLELKDFDKNWVEFIAKKLNKDTQQLTLEQGFLTQERFSNISTFLPELKFVYIINNQLTDKTNAEWIVTFIKSSKKLNALFSDLQMEKTEQNKLKEDLKKDKWKVEIIDEDESKNRIHLSIR